MSKIFKVNINLKLILCLTPILHSFNIVSQPIHLHSFLAFTHQLYLMISQNPLLTGLVLWSEYLCPSQNSDVEILPFNVIVLRDGTFGKWLGHKKWSPHEQIIPYKRSSKEILSLFSHVRTQWKGSDPRRELSLEYGHGDSLILDFPDFRTVRNTFLLFISYPGGYLLYSSLNQVRWICWSSEMKKESKSC